MTTHFGRKLARRAEASLDLCAVWAIGPEAPVLPRPGANRPVSPVRFGTSTDPGDILRDARSWHWSDNIVLRAVVWCDTRQGAVRVAGRLNVLASDDRLNARWADVEDVEALIREAARIEGVEVFDDATRQERLRLAVEGYVRQLRRR